MHYSVGMGQIWEKHIQDRLKELEESLLEDYKKQSRMEKRDYAVYEKEFKERFRKAMKNLAPLIKKATKKLEFYRGRGDKPSLKIDQRLRLLLISQLIGKSNRMMSYMTGLFSLLTGMDRSYKTIERLYSDKEVEVALFNLFVLILKKRKVKEIDCCGDATGYGLIISKHYATEAQKLKEKIKTANGQNKKSKKKGKKQKKKLFVYEFALMDLKTKMYVCYGTSLISEKKAFDKAICMLKQLDISIKSIRLDKYYSLPGYVKLFPKSKVYIIPRKNAKLGHGQQWLKVMKSFVENTLKHLEEYYKRNNSESGFSADKKMFGWRVKQKREDRIDTALFCRCIWRNLLHL